MSFPYHVNDVVLARVPNGNIYYTKLKSISHARKECVAEFDDGSIATVDWTNIFDVAAETDVIVCVVCKKGESEKPNEIILCDTCNVGYHQNCHPTRITPEHIAKEKWHCHFCTHKRKKNPYVINPFDTPRNKMPLKGEGKRKFTKSPTKSGKIPTKRRKLNKSSAPKVHKPSKSFIAKKCTVAIVKKSMCDKGISEEPIEPSPAEPKKRPVNAVQPLKYNMAYPVCSPPPLQMSPLVKQISHSKPSTASPLSAPPGLHPDAMMSSLPPLQRARMADKDPLRSRKVMPSFDSRKVSPPLEPAAPPMIPTALPVPEPPTVEQEEQSAPTPPSTRPGSNIGHEQIRGLYMQILDFVQQTRAQGNPVIDRQVVQDLISYGNEQIQRLSTTTNTTTTPIDPSQPDHAPNSEQTSDITVGQESSLRIERRSPVPESAPCNKDPGNTQNVDLAKPVDSTLNVGVEPSADCPSKITSLEVANSTATSVIKKSSESQMTTIKIIEKPDISKIPATIQKPTIPPPESAITEAPSAPVAVPSPVPSSNLAVQQSNDCTPTAPCDYTAVQSGGSLLIAPTSANLEDYSADNYCVPVQFICESGSLMKSKQSVIKQAGVKEDPSSSAPVENSPHESLPSEESPAQTVSSHSDQPASPSEMKQMGVIKEASVPVETYQTPQLKQRQDHSPTSVTPVKPVTENSDSHNPVSPNLGASSVSSLSCEEETMKVGSAVAAGDITESRKDPKFNETTATAHGPVQQQPQAGEQQKLQPQQQQLQQQLQPQQHLQQQLHPPHPPDNQEQQQHPLHPILQQVVEQHENQLQQQQQLQQKQIQESKLQHKHVQQLRLLQEHQEREHHETLQQQEKQQQAQLQHQAEQQADQQQSSSQNIPCFDKPEPDPGPSSTPNYPVSIPSAVNPTTIISDSTRQDKASTSVPSKQLMSQKPKINTPCFTIFDSYSSLFDSDDDDDDGYVPRKQTQPQAPAPKPSLPNQQFQNRAKPNSRWTPPTTASSQCKAANVSQEPTPLSVDDLLSDLQPTALKPTSFSSQPTTTPHSNSASSQSHFSGSPAPSSFSPTHTNAIPTMSSNPAHPVAQLALHAHASVVGSVQAAAAKHCSDLAMCLQTLLLKEPSINQHLLLSTLLHGTLSAAYKKHKNDESKSKPPEEMKSEPLLNPNSGSTHSHQTATNQTSESFRQSQVNVQDSQEQDMAQPNSTISGSNEVSKVCSCPNSSRNEGLTKGILDKENKNLQSSSVSDNSTSRQNKNEISGQCYNCYSTAVIACRRCANALYCSLRCEVEHSAVHRRECGKRH